MTLQTSPIRTGARGNSGGGTMSSSASVSPPFGIQTPSSSSSIAVPSVSRPTTTPIAVRPNNKFGGGGGIGNGLSGRGHGGSRQQHGGQQPKQKRVGLKDFERIRVLGKGKRNVELMTDYHLVLFDILLNSTINTMNIFIFYFFILLFFYFIL